MPTALVRWSRSTCTGWGRRTGRSWLRLLRRQRHWMDRVGVRQPTVEVRWRNLRVDAEWQVVDVKPLPTLLNSAISKLSVSNYLLFCTTTHLTTCSLKCLCCHLRLLTTMLGFNHNQERIHILKASSNLPDEDDPSPWTPGLWQNHLLLALAGKLTKLLR